MRSRRVCRSMGLVAHTRPGVVGARLDFYPCRYLGRWSDERRRAALNALNFGDDDDDALDHLEEPWRIFES